MKEYEVLRKKYSLPNLKELEQDFGFEEIEEQKYLLRAIVNKIIDTIETHAKLLEEIINPEASISNMNEASSFNEEEKPLILKNYKKLLFYHRSHMQINLNYDEKSFADFLNTFYEDWHKIKVDLNTIIGKMKNSWKKDVKTKIELGYFG